MIYSFIEFLKLLTLIDSNLIWENSNGQKKIFLKISNNESSHSDLILLNPYISKLAAALFNGLEIFPIQSKSRILVNDEFSKITLEHISKIITDGKIYHLENNNYKKILDMKNIETMQLLKNPVDFLKNNKMLDTLYLDLKQNENILEMIKNYEPILKQKGFLLFLYNFQSIENQNNKKELQILLNKLKDTFEMVQEINLTDFFKSSFMIIMTKI